MNLLSNKLLYTITTIDKLMHRLFNGSKICYINTCSHEIITFGKINHSLGFFYNYHVENDDEYPQRILDKVKDTVLARMEDIHKYIYI